MQVSAAWQRSAALFPVTDVEDLKAQIIKVTTKRLKLSINLLVFRKFNYLVNEL